MNFKCHKVSKFSRSIFKKENNYHIIEMPYNIAEKVIKFVAVHTVYCKYSFIILYMIEGGGY
jgi:hypothetical protein